MKYWVLVRDDEYQVIAVFPGHNPLYGYGSWDIFSGPFDTALEAEEQAYDFEMAAEAE